MHVMLALDQSRYAEAVLRWMKAFSFPAGTYLTLVHVLEPLDVPEALGAEHRHLVQQQEQAGARVLLSKAEQELKKYYPDIKLIIRKGLPIYELLKLVRDERPSVIVSGSRGLQGAHGLALGSVSQRLLAYAPCSVLLIPAQVKPRQQPKVMLATDGSRGAKTAARLLTLFPDIREVMVVSAVRPIHNRDLMRDGVDPAQFRAVRTLVMRARREAANRAVEETVRVLAVGAATITTRIVIGHAAEAIPRLAQENRCDLLVLGSRGLTGMMATAMGSVSLAVAQAAPCPVLVVKRAV